MIHILCVKRNKYIERFAPTPATPTPATPTPATPTPATPTPATPTPATPTPATPTPSNNDGWNKAEMLSWMPVPTTDDYRGMSCAPNIPSNLNPNRTARSTQADYGSPICKDGCYQIKCEGSACNNTHPILIRMVDKMFTQGAPLSGGVAIDINKTAYDIIVNETKADLNRPTFYYKKVSCEDMKPDDPNPIVNN